MFGTEIIEVGIGLAFAYFAISIICSGIVELGVKLTNLRAKHLKKGLGLLLGDKNYNGFVGELYQHHLIASPLKDKLGDPVCIDAKNFAAAVLEILGKNDNLSDEAQFKLIEARIMTIKDKNTRDRLLAILKSSARHFDTLRAKIENWFNESMEGVSEWYRRRMRLWVTLVSLFVVGLMDADTIKMATMFWNDDELRSATVQAAQGYSESMKERMAERDAADRAAAANASAAQDSGKTPVDTLTSSQLPLDSAAQARADSFKAVQDLHQLKLSLDNLYTDINAAKVLPIGWSYEKMPAFDSENSKPWRTWWMLKLAGLILTVGAVSLGSTYWYKQLQSLLRLRFGKNQQEPKTGPDPVPPTGGPYPQTSSFGDGEESLGAGVEQKEGEIQESEEGESPKNPKKDL